MSRLGLCLDPDLPQSAGIVAKAMRAIDPGSGKNPRDVAVRAGKQRALFAQMTRFMKQGIPSEAVYPGFGPRSQEPGESQVAVPVPKRAIDRLVQKIVRGLTYLESGKFIEPTHVIESHVMHEESAAEIREQFRRFGKTYERKPGLLVERCVTPEDGISSIYRIEIWGQFRVYASVTQNHSNAVA